MKCYAKSDQSRDENKLHISNDIPESSVIMNIW